jgi:hypothetical protein
LHFARCKRKEIVQKIIFALQEVHTTNFLLIGHLEIHDQITYQKGEYATRWLKLEDPDGAVMMVPVNLLACS